MEVMSRRMRSTRERGQGVRSMGKLKRKQQRLYFPSTSIGENNTASGLVTRGCISVQLRKLFMIARHGFSSALRPPSVTPNRFSTQRLSYTKPESSNHNPRQSNASKSDSSYVSLTSGFPPGHPSHLSNTVRALMRRVPHPLTIILSHSPESQSPTGLLISSFNTVTLSPHPLVSFNIKLPSSTYSSIVASGRFTASAVGKTHLAKAFIKGGDFGIEPWKYADQDSQDGRLVAGVGALWWMKCQWIKEKSVDVGDHVIVVGKLLEAGEYEGGHKLPRLIYSGGKYRKTGEVIDI